MNFTQLRPLGPVLPDTLNPQGLRAWLLGLFDGWAQPQELSSSTAVAPEVQESLDRGINAGQWLHSPFNHQQ